ncbi:MAG: hypothetical protein Q9159_006840 [Coniocarpon cinnabarinum]
MHKFAKEMDHFLPTHHGPTPPQRSSTFPHHGYPPNGTPTSPTGAYSYYGSGPPQGFNDPQSGAYSSYRPAPEQTSNDPSARPRRRTPSSEVEEPPSPTEAEPNKTGKHRLLPAPKPHVPEWLQTSHEKPDAGPSRSKRAEKSSPKTDGTRSKTDDKRPKADGKRPKNLSSIFKVDDPQGREIVRYQRKPRPNDGATANSASNDFLQRHRSRQDQSMSQPSKHVAAVCGALPGIAERLRRDKKYDVRTFFASKYMNEKGIPSAAESLSKAFHEEHGGIMFRVKDFIEASRSMNLGWDKDRENALRCAHIKLRVQRSLETIEDFL